MAGCPALGSTASVRVLSNVLFNVQRPSQRALYGLKQRYLDVILESQKRRKPGEDEVTKLTITVNSHLKHTGQTDQCRLINGSFLYKKLREIMYYPYAANPCL